MKLSELTDTGDRYECSSGDWGDANALIIDRDRAIEAMAELFDCSEAEIERTMDGRDVEIWRDRDGNLYAVTENHFYIARVEDDIEHPEHGEDGMVALADRWEEIEDEE